MAESIASEKGFDKVSEFPGPVFCLVILGGEESIIFVRRTIPIKESIDAL